MEYSFNLQIAEKFGVNAAIFLKNIGFWIAKNTGNNKHCYDGYHWTYNSISSFTALFPFWNERQIYTVVNNLLEKKIIKKGNYNKIGYDRTLWYTIIDKEVFSICVEPILHKSKMEVTKKQNPTTKKVTPIPDINTDVNPDNKPNKKEKPIKHKHGEYKHVQLTDIEYDKLKERFGDFTKDKIKNLDEYLEIKNVSYKNHYLVILKWERSNEKNQRNFKPGFKGSGEEVREGKTPEKLSNNSTEVSIG
jgi:hypothetical protein